MHNTICSWSSIVLKYISRSAAAIITSADLLQHQQCSRALAVTEFDVTGD
jgi:hypothetical protein